MSSDPPPWTPGTAELSLGPDGSPENPLLVLSLDQWETASPDRIARTAASLSASLRLTIGVLRHPPTPALAPLLRALTLTLVASETTPSTTVSASRGSSMPRSRLDVSAGAPPSADSVTATIPGSPSPSPRRRPTTPNSQRSPGAAVEGDALADQASADLDLFIVECPDVDEALTRLRAAVERSPRASVALGRLLRQTPDLDTVSGLAAEAVTYSMLLSGTEFARWLSERGSPRAEAASDRPLVRVDRDGDRLEILLDHPERRNALSFRLREELLEAVGLVAYDPEIAKVDLRGAGPAFCSGGDLDEFGTATDLTAAYLVRLERAPWRVIDAVRDRVTAHVHGACIGAGMEMAAFAGAVIAAPDTVFRLPEIDMGLVPGAGGTVSVPRRIGRWRAAWLMLTGLPLDARTALRWGLVDALDHRPDTASMR
ncbi:enoyl-CoA hydratase/isomerase family protein [Nocardia takedensis]